MTRSVIVWKGGNRREVRSDSVDGKFGGVEVSVMSSKRDLVYHL